MAAADVYGFTLVDFSVPSRDAPMIHPVADAPSHALSYGKPVDATFFDPNCPEGQEILQDPKTSIPELFAIVRQWVPQIQKNMQTLAKEILRRGAHVDDRDGLTDQTLLHYACKAGACGVGDETAAIAVVQSLITKGADVNARCRWTNMTPLHYAAFFNCPRLVHCLASKGAKRGMNDVCVEFEKGTALHIAAAGLGKEVVECLLELGADANIQDDHKRKPWQCVPTGDDVPADQHKRAADIVHLLQEASDTNKKPMTFAKSEVGVSNHDFNLGDRIIVGGSRSGTLRFFGEAEFAPGKWAGIELDDAVGKNDGSVQGKVYFKCPPKHGLFAPLSRVAKAMTSAPVLPYPTSLSPPFGTPTHGSRVPPMRVDKPHSSSPQADSSGQVSPTLPTGSDYYDTDLKVGDQVIVAGSKRGILRFVGPAKFAPGIWMGIELDQAVGKNDGSVGGEKYFTCKPKHGVFAPGSRVVKVADAVSGTGTYGVQPRSTTPSTSAPATPKKESRPSSRMRQPSRQSQSGSTGALAEGTNVLVTGEMGVLRYIGPTQFADGVWLGIELKKPVGKNDGSVQGKRYFTCKPNFGILVRPSRATIRGVSCARLLAEGTNQ
ncbi:CAP-Gly domain-containing linker protein 4-like isoform X2 [Corticium candelabrum]|uniref:CAP-Gly domain-containing linker protein 4-like isoform X2 n=1 Tax=Corticium candelabrum TaxID=121492 RepID=UPI002E252DC5|nr:CAP-Gly domain-containing linker protein 4-like isoform X2 [Corticium candelabrum]